MLDLSYYAQSKGFKEQKMYNWFQQIVSFLLKLYKIISCKENEYTKSLLLKETFLQESFKRPTASYSSTCTNRNKSSNINLATSIAADLHKTQHAEKGCQRLTGQKDQQTKTLKKLRKENQNHGPKQQVRLLLKQAKHFLNIFSKRENRDY